MDSLTDTSVLVTGGSGFFGRAFVRAALMAGSPRVCVFSRGEHQQALMRKEFDAWDDRIRFFIGDVRDRERMLRAMDGIDLVVHAAALKRVEVGEYDSAEMVKTNVVGTMNVIDAAHDAGVEKLVALSSDKACEPTNCYGASKLVMEKLVLAANNARGGFGTRLAVTRYGNVAGSTGSVIPTWRREIEAGRPVRLTHPDATRFWMTLDHAVQLVMGTALTMQGGELVVPELPAYRLGDLAVAMDLPAGMHITGLGPGEKLHESMAPGNSSDLARRMTVEEIREGLKHV